MLSITPPSATASTASASPVASRGRAASTSVPCRPLPFTCSSSSIARSAPIRHLHAPPHADLADVPRTLLRLGEVRDRELQLDWAEPLVLHGPYHLKPDQLEERKEGHDDLPPPRLRREDLRKFDPASEGETGQDPGDAFGDRQSRLGQPMRRRRREPGQHPAQRVQEIRQA